MTEQKSKTPLRRAVDYLISKGKLDADKDLTERFNLSASTISGYLNGVPGKNFVRDFEKEFEISLKDFEKDELPKGDKPSEDQQITIADLRALIYSNKTLVESNKVLVDNNKTLVDAHKDITTVVERRSRIAVQAIEHGLIHSPQDDVPMIGDLLVSIADEVLDKKPQSKTELLALLSKVYSDHVQNTVLQEGIQKSSGT
jgi:hypothetical protein